MPKIVKLASGQLDGDGQDVSEGVYDRPVRMVYTGHFDSMDGKVEITPEHLALMESNHNSFLSRMKRLASGEVSIGECPPLQLDHSTSATMTVGRVFGPLRMAEAEVDGKKVMALFGTARFLGRENVEKAKDGRYHQVSIGADLESGRLNELSVTPFPAAPHASLLCRMAKHNGVEYEIKEVNPGEYDIVIDGKKVSHHAGTPSEVEEEACRYIDHEKGESEMKEKLKKHLMEQRKMSAEEADKKADESMKHHMSAHKMSEEDMSKHLEKADDDECKRMADAHDEHMKHLEKEKEENEKKLSSAKTKFVQLVKGMTNDVSEVKIELRKATVSGRLSRLRKEAKITPAEIKKLDIIKMAELNDEAMEAALSTFETREPQVLFGAMAGTTKGEAIDTIAKKYRMARLELESRMNMPSKRSDAVEKLARLAEEEKKEKEAVEHEPSKGMLGKMSYDELCKMMEDKGRHEELKGYFKRMLEERDHHEMGEGDDKRMSALAKKHSALQTQLQELIQIASPALGVSTEELK